MRIGALPSVPALALAISACAEPPAAPPAAPAAPPRDPRGAAVDAIFARWDKRDSPGCAVAVSQGGEVVHARGYGMADLEHGAPITPATPFMVASVSKQFTGFAAAVLEEGGKLSLDDDIRKHLPELRGFDKKVTVGDLVHHTSGLREQYELMNLTGVNDDHDVFTQKDVMALLARQRELNFAPGSRFLYSNSNYTLLAAVVERVSGRSLDTYLREIAFTPLGMSETHFHEDRTRLVPGRAYAYAPKEGGGHRLATPQFEHVGPTGLFSSVQDLLRWARNFDDGKAGGKGVVARMLTAAPPAGGGGEGYGYGVGFNRVRGVRREWHGGMHSAFTTMLMRLPDQRLAIACACNTRETKAWEEAERVAEVYLGRALGPEAEPPTEARDLADLAARAGAYYSADRDDFYLITHAGGELRSEGQGLIPIGPDRFRIGLSKLITFEQPAGGAPLRLIEAERRQAWAKPEVFERVKAPAVRAEERQQLAGAYRSEELDLTLTLKVEKDKLALSRRRQSDVLLEPFAPDIFVNDDFGLVHVFRGADNKPAGFRLTVGRARRIRFDRI